MLYREKNEEWKQSTQPNPVALLVGISKNGDVIHFNQGCEELTGFSRDDVLHRKLSEVLIPEHYRQQWDNILQLINSRKEVEDFVIPWLTYDGTETVIVWSYLTQSDTNDSDSKEIIYFTGKQTLGYTPPVTHPNTTPIQPSLTKETYNEEQVPHADTANDILVFTFGNKRIKMRKRPDRTPASSPEYTPLEKMHGLKKTAPLNTPQVHRVTETVQTVPLEQKESSEMITASEQQERTAEDTTEEKTLHDGIQQRTTNNKTSVSHESSTKNQTPISRKPFRRSKRREELERQIHESEERYHLLQLYEAQLLDEKKTLEANKVAFQQWRKKLEQLENEIERRRVELIREEQAFRERILAYSSHHRPSDLTIEDSTDIEMQYHEVLDKIPESAVVLQRGMVKQANQPFAALVGYSSEELVEKRFYDFIDPEELGNLEHYLLNRLKGDESSSYDTVFCKKNKDKIPVTVNVKSTLYQGERADLIIIKTVPEK